jgi:hypothetical protein
MTRTWRESCSPLIRQVLKDNEGKSEKEIRKALKEAYPFGQRAMHPYKIWLDEIKRQRGLKKKVSAKVGENQTSLF